MEELLEVSGVPTIMVLVYGAMMLYRNFIGENEKLKRLIPSIASIVGAVLGVVAFYTAPGMVPASNVISAILVGFSSGLAATGTNQILKQLQAFKIITPVVAEETFKGTAEETEEEIKEKEQNDETES